MTLPKSWEEKELGEICEVKKGTSITKDKVTPGSVPVIAGGQQPAYFHNISNRDGKTITVSASGAYSGFINYFEHPIFASDCTTIQSLNEEKALSKYIYLALKSQQNRVYSLQTGAGQPHVYAKDLVKLRIPIPPTPIQRKIVAILERAEAIKRKRQEVIESTNKLSQSVFLEMFGDPQTNPKNWETKTLYELSKEKPKYGSGASAIAYNGDIRYVRITDIDEDGNLKQEKVSPSLFEDEYLLEEDDLLFARSGATVGKTLLYNKMAGKCIYAGYLIRFRFNNNCNSRYIYELTKTTYYRNWVSTIQTKVAQPNINAKLYGQLKVPVPPLALQQKFANSAKKLEAIGQRQQQSLKYEEELFNSLVQRAFSGELIS